MLCFWQYMILLFGTWKYVKFPIAWISNLWLLSFSAAETSLIFQELSIALKCVVWPGKYD
jgi:hypothetical protein